MVEAFKYFSSHLFSIGLMHYLILAATLFAIGLYGVLTKRGIITVLMSIELMLNAVNINFIAFNHFTLVNDTSGQLMAMFIIAVAASELAIGMAMAFRIYHDRKTVNVDELRDMRG